MLAEEARGRPLIEMEDGFDLDGHPIGQRSHADCGARVLARFPQYLD